MAPKKVRIGLYSISILDSCANSVCVHFGGLAILVLECGNFSFAEVFLEFLQRLQFLATLLNPWIFVQHFRHRRQHVFKCFKHHDVGKRQLKWEKTPIRSLEIGLWFLFRGAKRCQECRFQLSQKVYLFQIVTKSLNHSCMLISKYFD